jgi:hypothetical protein
MKPSAVHFLRVAACWCAWVAAGHPLPAAPAVSKEHQVQAAFIYNFAKYIQWPEKRLAGATAPLVIVVLGDSPVADELTKVVFGRQANGRGIIVRSSTDPAASTAAEAHLVFVPAGQEGRFAEAAEAWSREAVVTVGESDRFAALGGIITFKREGDKVRFAVNLDAAEQADVRLSAQLLKLASAVHRKS